MRETKIILHGQEFTVIERFEGNISILDCLRGLLEFYVDNPANEG